MTRWQWITVGSLVVGVVAIAFAVYAWRRPRLARTKLTFRSDQSVVSPQPSGPSAHVPEGLSMAFMGHKISQLVVTRVTIANEGAVPVTSEDVRAPVMFHLTAPHVLVEPAVTEAVPRIGASCVISSDASEHSFTVKFDHLEPRDWLSIDVVHDGIDEPISEVAGAVIGMPDGIARHRASDELESDAVDPRTLGRIVVGAVSCFILFVGYLVYGVVFRDWWSDPPGALPSDTPAIVEADCDGEIALGRTELPGGLIADAAIVFRLPASSDGCLLRYDLRNDWESFTAEAFITSFEEPGREVQIVLQQDGNVTEVPVTSNDQLLEVDLYPGGELTIEVLDQSMRGAVTLVLYDVDFDRHYDEAA